MILADNYRINLDFNYITNQDIKFIRLINLYHQLLVLGYVEGENIGINNNYILWIGNKYLNSNMSQEVAIDVTQLWNEYINIPIDLEGTAFDYADWLKTYIIDFSQNETTKDGVKSEFIGWVDGWDYSKIDFYRFRFVGNFESMIYDNCDSNAVLSNALKTYNGTFLLNVFYDGTFSDSGGYVSVFLNGNNVYLNYPTKQGNQITNDSSVGVGTHTRDYWYINYNDLTTVEQQNVSSNTSSLNNILISSNDGRLICSDSSGWAIRVNLSSPKTFYNLIGNESNFSKQMNEMTKNFFGTPPRCCLLDCFQNG